MQRMRISKRKIACRTCSRAVPVHMRDLLLLLQEFSLGVFKKQAISGTDENLYCHALLS